ncbi:hypothetical protein L6452_06092 [Arctium lappa]|uniref:Uncharacterized protein n=1 Tax=Arctium lappa TaxID=4217 RepID=A0ACB9EI56_ARCLA|nr:hypothetical protein L6452_06092 [Arctium lappa]
MTRTPLVLFSFLRRLLWKLQKWERHTICPKRLYINGGRRRRKSEITDFLLISAFQAYDFLRFPSFEATKVEAHLNQQMPLKHSCCISFDGGGYGPWRA